MAIDNPQWIEARPAHVLVVHVRVHRAVSVELRLADGTAVPMDVVAGHAVVAVTDSALPTVVIATDADGKVVASLPLHFPPQPYLEACPEICSGGGGGFEFYQVTLKPKKEGRR